MLSSFANLLAIGLKRVGKIILDITAVNIRESFMDPVIKFILTPSVPATTIMERGAERIREMQSASRIFILMK